ncbi:MAG: hypothetical protein IJ067_05390 [Prevotella sp.]|nr:hypothetical protein [Prevotella sp.]
MKQKFFALFAAAVLLLGMSACKAKEDNPVTPPEEEDEVLNIPELEIDPSEFQPIDVSVALLGSLSNSAEEEVVRYWFTDVHGQVTDETMVVITDEITATNEDDILTVLDRYGMLLLVDPKEDNVRQYAEEMGIDPNADYSKLELIGLTGLGDQYLSYNDDESASEDLKVPASFASDAVWDVAPAEYLRLKAFAQWVDLVVEKYTEYQKQLAELEKEEQNEPDAWADDEPAQTRGTSGRALTRSAGSDVKTGLSLNSVPAVDKSINVTHEQKFKSFHNEGRDDDHETCYFSATCNYHFIPLYQFPQGSDPGGDYYIIETSMNWDCSRTDMGYYKYSHGVATARDSYRFFPLQCTLYSTPIPKKSEYEVIVPVNGEIYPENVPHETTVNKSRNFELTGNISAGGGFKKDKDGTEGEGNLSADIGFGANYSKSQDYTVAEINVDKYTVNSGVGHIFSVPNEYHPKKESGHTPTIYVEKGTNFAKTLSVNESWIWKVNGTQIDTDDVPFDIELTVKPKVCWYSYFFAVESLDREDYQVEMKGMTTVPAPVRTNHAFLTITNNREDLHIFGIKVTDTESKEVVYKKKSTDKEPGESVRLALPANREYDIELKMGTEWNNKETYILKGWEVEGYADAESTSTSIFSKK